MQDRLEFSEIPLTKLENNIRIEPEFYKKNFIIYENRISSMNISSFEKEAISIKKGIFDIKAETYTSEGIPFVRISNLKNLIIDTSDIVFIDEKTNENNLTTQLDYGDIILSKTAIPAASFVNIEKCNTSQDTIAIKLNKKSCILSSYAVVFLNTKYGLSSLERRFTGNIQMHLSLEDVRKKISIPVFSTDFQKLIDTIFINHMKYLSNFKSKYLESEKILLAELGLNNYRPSKKNIAITKLSSSFFESGRLDAEYYQFRYDEIKNKIEENGNALELLSNYINFNFRGLQPEYEICGEIDVINSRHILNGYLDYANFEKTSFKSWNTNSRAQVFENDILLYTTGANIGRTAVYLSKNKALASNHVNILRIKNINPIYTAVVLNSIIGKLQTEKFSAGSAQQELYPKDIEKFFIPIIDTQVQQKIAKIIEKSFNIKAKSETYLLMAKQAVEMAIEDGEDTATKWLKEKMAEIESE